MAWNLLCWNLMPEPSKIPREFDDLPEPARSKAFEFFRELLDGGANTQQAVEQARDRARHWMAERAPATH